MTTMAATKTIEDFPGAYSGQGRSWERMVRGQIEVLPLRPGRAEAEDSAEAEGATDAEGHGGTRGGVGPEQVWQHVR